MTSAKAQSRCRGRGHRRCSPRRACDGVARSKQKGIISSLGRGPGFLRACRLPSTAFVSLERVVALGYDATQSKDVNLLILRDIDDIRAERGDETE
jgi:hypothetical protein